MPDSGFLNSLATLALLGAVLVALTVGIAHRAAKRTPPLGRWVDLPAARVHVLERAGPQGSTALPLILIHGLGGQLRHFSDQLIDELAASHRVIAFDRPGSGYSTWKTRTRFTLSDQVDLVAALASHLGVQRFIVVGHSLGGALAIGVALQHRERVAGLALLAPLTRLPAGAPTDLAAVLRKADWGWRVLAWSWAIPVARLRRSHWLRGIFFPDRVPSDFAIRGGGDLVLRPSHVLGAARDALDIPEWLSSLVPLYPTLSGPASLPIGVLYGRQDRVLSAVEQGERFAQELAHVELQQIDAGHMLPLVWPDECARLIRRVAAAAGA